MKIKVAICTIDTQYSERITYYFQSHYYDKFTWNIFTESSFLENFIRQTDVDIILVGKEMKKIFEVLCQDKENERIFACLVDDIDEEIPFANYRIEKYARADKIYRDLLELYSHKSNAHFHNSAIVNDKTEIYAFVSAAGGVGASTVACAMAASCAKFQKVLYINLENLGAPQILFTGQGNGGIDEIIYALKSRRKALELKIASSVSRDKCGVYFFGASKSALDVMEMTQENLKELLVAIQQMREYDKVIIDVGNGLGEKEIAAMTYAGRVVVVMENSEISEKKFIKYVEAMQVIELQKTVDICSKMVIFYNKVSRQTRLPEQLCQVRVAGGLPKIENGTYTGVVEKITEMEVIHNVE